MKNMLPLFFLLFACDAVCQVNTILPSEATAFYQNSMQHLKPAIRNLIEKNASKLTGQKVNTDSLMRELQKDPLLRTASAGDLKAITVLILVQASKNADNNLKELVLQKRNDGNKNDAEKEKDKQYASLLLENKSEIAQKVALIMMQNSLSPEMTLDKFK
jgi:hypothetical protein